MANITNQEVLELMDKKGLTIFQVIDVIIEANHLIGVGIIDLENIIKQYLREKASKVNKTPKGMEALND